MSPELTFDLRWLAGGARHCGCRRWFDAFLLLAILN